LEARAASKEMLMAMLGARMLSPDKKAAETAEAATIHRQGELSVLASLSNSVSIAITKALMLLAEWSGIEGEIDFKLNKDFTPAGLNAPEITALVQSWQSGAIAYSDLFDNLQRGEIIDPLRTPEDVRAEVEQENPFQASDFESV